LLHDAFDIVPIVLNTMAFFGHSLILEKGKWEIIASPNSPAYEFLFLPLKAQSPAIIPFFKNLW